MCGEREGEGGGKGEREGGREGRLGRERGGGGVGKECMLKNVCGEGIDIRLFSVLLL